MRSALAWLSNQLRTCGENIGRAPTGREAQQMLNDLLNRMHEEIEKGVLRV